MRSGTTSQLIVPATDAGRWPVPQQRPRTIHTHDATLHGADNATCELPSAAAFES